MKAEDSKKTGQSFSAVTVSPSLAGKLAASGIRNEFDLVLHLPLRYEDETRLDSIRDAPEGRPVQLEGVVIRCDVMYRPRRQLVCQIQDDSGTVFIRFLHFYGSQVKAYAMGTRMRVLGEVRQGFFGPEMVHPKCHVVKAGKPLADTLTPVYPAVKGVARETMRKLVYQVLHDDAVARSGCLAEILPEQITRKYQLESFPGSVKLLHYPLPGMPVDALQQRTHPVWQRIRFDELLAQQLSLRLHYHQRRGFHAPVLRPTGHLAEKLIQQLSYQLTDAQQRVIAEICHDLAMPYPMQRLLQGDVGSGKTIVAALTVLQVISNGCQAAIMAPTEILAEQHFQQFSRWFEPLGITLVLITGSQKNARRQAAVTAIATGQVMLAVGTHALFQGDIRFARLGFVIIDEQHRFGVGQRLALRMKGMESGLVPHQLMMSATPIPRTLSMSYYADLDISVIDSLPPGRSPVTTRLVEDYRRDEVIARIREACRSGRQAYWICPLIEESAALQLKTAIETFATLRTIFPDLKTGLVHGRLPAKEKAELMRAFRQGEIQLLVATTVIEVGVDVPNASLMVIEHAERMGLSQLHQLRGRVGRGTEVSVCILLYQQPLSDIARERLRVIFKHTDGFEIARHDLRIRGPGEFLGVQQSGVPLLRFADLEQDAGLLEQARTVAEILLRDNPDVAQQHLQRWSGNRNEYLRV